jgi:hypothetical protein
MPIVFNASNSLHSGLSFSWTIIAAAHATCAAFHLQVSVIWQSYLISHLKQLSRYPLWEVKDTYTLRVREYIGSFSYRIAESVTFSSI